MATRRESLQIIGEILEQDGSSQTAIRLSLGLTSKQMRTYVHPLLDRGFLEESSGHGLKGKRFNATPIGKELQAKIRELMDYMSLGDSI